MSQLTQQLLVSIAPAVIGGVVAAIITAWLSLRRFYSEKWWERKADTYAEIMEALYDLFNDPASTFDEEIHDEGGNIPEAEREERSRRALESRKHLYKMIEVGNFIISDKAVEILRQVRGELNAARQQPDFFSFLDKQAGAARRGIEALRIEAKRDLKLTRSWFPWR